jgi:peptidoglycan hydrolase CwlO-like protein
MVSEHPMSLSERTHRPLYEEGKLSQLNEIIAGQSYQNMYLNEARETAECQLSILQTQLSELQSTVDSKEFDIQQLQQRLERSERMKADLEESVNNLNRRLT